MKELLLIAACLVITIALDPLIARFTRYLEARRSRRK